MPKFKTIAPVLAGISLMAAPAIADPIQLGAPLPLTGPFAADGILMEQAIRLAVQDLNAAGGIDGEQVEVVTFDIGDLTPDKLQAAAANLIEREGVDVLINGYGGMGPDIPAFCPYGIPYLHIDAVSSVIDLAERMRCSAIFNASDVDVNYGARVFEQTLLTGAEFDNQSLAIVHGPFEWELNIAEGMRAAAENAGWDVVMVEEVTYENLEFTGIVSRLRELNPAYVHIEALDPAVTTSFVNQFRSNPPESSWLSVGYMGATPGIDAIVAEGIADGVFAFTLNAHFDDADGNAFAARWQEAYGAQPALSLAAAIYDMVNLWAEAASAAGDPSDSAAVADAIRGLNYAGLTGRFVFNERNFIDNGDETQPAQLIQIQDGERVRVVIGTETVAPVQMPDWLQ